MAHDVFISYSSKDKPIADAICAHLEAAGIRCWIAPRDIGAGEDWPTAIARAISQGQALVLVFSAHSNSSEEVGRELFLAANHKLVIIPFKIENVEPEPGMQYYLARTHWLDALNPPTRGQIQALVDCVKTLIPRREPAIAEIHPPSEVAPTAPVGSEKQASKKRRLSPWLWSIPAGIVLLCLFGLAAYSLAPKLLAAVLPQTPQPTSTSTLPPTSVPTLTPKLLSSPTATKVNFQAIKFIQSYIKEPFDDNSLEWSVGDVIGPYWLGTRLIENGTLNWDGTSEQAMNSYVSPDASDKQTYLSDVQVSARVNQPDPDWYGGYGLFLRASADEESYYLFIISQGQFAFYAHLTDGTWITVIDWQASPYITAGQWNTIMIQAVGSHFRLFFNDHLLSEAEDPSLSSGQSGIMVTAYDANQKIQVQFDDFEVLLPAP